MNKYIKKSEGVWNHPYIESKTIGDWQGYEPIYNGGCFAIIPHNDKFVFFAEDDDNYWETEIVSKSELLDLQKIYFELNKDISVKIDYMAGKSSQIYKNSKEYFLNKNRSVGMWKVVVVDRGEETAPLVQLNGDTFDVSHVEERLLVINSVLEL